MKMASTAAESIATPARSEAPPKLSNLRFDNRALRELPIDSDTANTIRQVRNACWAKVAPTPLDSPRMVAYSKSCMALIGVSPEEMETEDAVEYFSGNKMLPGGTETASHCYAGHQFGSFAGQLGDGAAILLGDVVNDKGEHWELQLKGAGLTPFSRTADGRKVLRSSIREFLCSEAMHFLGVPTTRAGSVITSDSRVARDIFYDGRVTHERCSVVLRVAPTFLRFGSFEIFKPRTPTGRAGPSVGNESLRRRMLNFVVRTYYPDAEKSSENGKAEDSGDVSGSAALEMFREVTRRTAELVAAWQCVGWVHGVLNTDNMSILGLTIDYGPYGWMDHFDSDFVPNGSDHGGRYSYKQQPKICKWNLQKLAEALAPAVPLEQTTEILEAEYDERFREAYEAGVRRKLGLSAAKSEDSELFKKLFATMEEAAADFTGTFRALAEFDLRDGGEAAINAAADRLAGLCAPPPVLVKALRRKLKIGQPSIPPQQLQALWAMAQEDPESLAARWGAPAEAIVAELRGEMEKLRAFAATAEKLPLMEQTSAEGKREADVTRFREWLSAYSSRLQLEPKETWTFAERQAAMNKANPAFVLRNWIAQEAIAAAETGDYSLVRRVLELLENPFDSPPQENDTCSMDAKYYGPAPEWAADLVCTCSS